jgi:hypothetical protein
MMISEMYIMLGGKGFLATNAEILCKVLHLTVAKVRPRGAKYVGLVLEALLREYPSDGGHLLLRSGILDTILRSCALNYASGKQCEPDRVISLYLNSLARVLHASPGILDSLLPLNASGTSDDSFGCISDNSFGYQELVRICSSQWCFVVVSESSHLFCSTRLAPTFSETAEP